MLADKAGDRSEDTELAKVSLDLAAFAAGRSDARRNFEWKVSLGIWALLAAAALRGFSTLSILFGPILLAAYADWLLNVWWRQVSDHSFLWHHVNEAQRILAGHGLQRSDGNEKLRAGSKKKYGFLSDWSMRFQFLVTLFLVVFLYIACCDKITWISTSIRAGGR